MKWTASTKLMWFVLLGLTAVVLHGIRINGDGGEYLMTTNAIFRHASVVILPADFAEFASLAPAKLARMNYPLEFYKQLTEEFRTPHPESWGGYASVRPEQLYSMHFWFYSLLAVPYYAVLQRAGLNPIWAFGLLNMTFIGLACVYLRRTMPQYGHLAVILVLSVGTTFYLRWTGPEVMGASCALIGIIALLRGQAGLAILLAGIGASQTPSLIFIAPFALGYRVLMYWRPQLAWPGVVIPKPGWRDVLLSACGIAIALSPYVFFQAIFGEPSLTGRYFTQRSLISVQRLLSLLFDLDQGMLAGLPGLFAGLLAAAFFVEASNRRRVLWTGACLLAIFGALAVPTLGTLNWNSGGVVPMRYGYWLAMPFLAILLLASQYMRPNRRVILVLIVLSLQSLVALEYGVLGQRSDPVRHSALATFALNHFPELYNPEPEIFYERGSGEEAQAPLSHQLVQLHQHNSQPLKLLRHSSNTAASIGLCSDNQRLEGTSVHSMEGGWEYIHGPFHCQRLPGSIALLRP